MPRLLSDQERAHLANNLQVVEGMSASAVPEAILLLAHDLSVIHGKVRLTKESGGIHLYMASPECLQRYGAGELGKMHLAVNAEKWIKRNKRRSAMCMKTGVVYAVDQLLRMPPIGQRGVSSDGCGQVLVVDEDKSNLEDDGKGNLVPRAPGRCVPLPELPPEHHCRQYVERRGYNVIQLWDQFGASYCYKEHPNGYYRRLINGFKVTPQGRLIFFVDVNGIRQGWQARLLEATDENKVRHWWHPYAESWKPVQRWDEADERWVYLPGWEAMEDPARYMTAPGAKRNRLLAGYDAAINLNPPVKDRYGRKVGFAMEGPMDAGRVGPPSVATMGKYFSGDQADLLAQHFERVIYIQDNDAGGLEGRRTFLEQFLDLGVLAESVCIPQRFKDPGDMTPLEAMQFKFHLLNE